MKSSSDRPAHRTSSTTHASPDPADLRQEWPFGERRKADRRVRDRRRLLGRDAARQCTVRERQIVELVLRGMTNKQIAQTLGIAEDTVKKHLLHAYRKLGVRRRALLIAECAASSSRS